MNTPKKPKPSFKELRVGMAHFGPSGNGTPQISDGDSARVLFFFNLSGAYNGYAGSPQAMTDAEFICRACNNHAPLAAVVKKLRDAAMNTPALDSSADWTALIEEADATLKLATP